MKAKVFLVSMFLFLLTCAAPAAAQPPDLPQAISLRSPTRAFNEVYYFAIHDGLIYIKERVNGASWQLLGDSGSPENLLGTPITSDAMEEISVDGPILIAVSETRQIYYCKNGYAAPGAISWTDHWGTPLGAGQGVSLPEDIRGWALSQDDLLRNRFYYDQNGNAYPCMVTTIYALFENGREIHFTDPWTPPDWGYRIAGPFRDRFIAESLSAAASTLFVINRFGDMYTHQNDFDIGGGNPFFNYTYEDDVHYDTNDAILNFSLVRKRRVPDQVWYNQPKIHGRITKNITIFFPEDGAPGESDRILRVEGVSEEGIPGYFEKNLEGLFWHFMETPGRIIPEEDFIDNPPENMSHLTLGEAPEYTFPGTMTNLIFGAVEAELTDFSLVASPANLRLKTEDGTWIDLKLHHHFTLRNTPREHPGEDGDYVDLKGAIEIPAELRASEDKAVTDLLRHYFYVGKGEEKRFAKVSIKAKTDSVTLQTTSLSMKMAFSAESTR
ncbi:hypothetical protein [Desulfoluna spongiiphila]|uniref:Uncharacterized protein n=1 Tax=Desulfoluna spongiiphila TaxID=419481 RepID=A0A1G5H876_9BACT|nr:hypothetical protein [Desulfoluna spongiiphila]SCY60095.1 hypothetical protein SAMN05216233_11314 [Desulfoluna spongiiphila]